MAIDKKDLCNTGAEALMLGCLLKDNSLLLDYYDKIYPHESYFSSPMALFFYKLLQDLFFVKKYENIDEIKINVYLEEDEIKKKLYKKYNGWTTLKRLKNNCDLKDKDIYFNTLQKYTILRELHEKNFPIEPILKVIDKITPEQIIESVEYQLNQIQMKIKGVEDSVLLGKNMVEVYDNWGKNPSIGISLPFPILDSFIRGMRKKKLHMCCMHSGRGKSRIMSRIITHTSIVNKVPLLILVNEQDVEEWNAMLLSSVINNIFYSKSNILINEAEIVTGRAHNDSKKNLLCIKASTWIEKNTNIYFVSLKKWDVKTLTRIIKKHKLKYGVEHFIVDTFKPMRLDKSMSGLATWEKFAESARLLKDLCNDLDVAGFITGQLTDESLFDKMLSSQSISGAKHIKHVLDVLLMARELNKAEYEDYYIDSDEYGRIDLSPSKTYYAMVIDKNRGGLDNLWICYEVDRGNNTWIELGLLKYNKIKK